jgi:hypothetical protein
MRVHFNSFDEQYQYILAEACGRQACSVLILVAFDVDGMAATRMLTQLFRSDHITYMIRPVVNFDEVKSAIKTSMTKDIKSVIMVNCGSVRITVFSRCSDHILIYFLVLCSLDLRYPKTFWIGTRRRLTSVYPRQPSSIPLKEHLLPS